MFHPPWASRQPQHNSGGSHWFPRHQLQLDQVDQLYQARQGGSETADLTGGSPSLEQSNRLTNFASAWRPDPLPCHGANPAMFGSMESSLGNSFISGSSGQIIQHYTSNGRQHKGRWMWDPYLLVSVHVIPYAAVRVPDEVSRNLLTYCRLLIREALCHCGEGWWEYNRLFHSQAVITPLVSWNTICPSLQAATLLGQHGTGGTFCTL